ncbi:MAG: DUF262 domain-containing protein [Planctomycetota bacterium]|nr:DUF262 domain-containing protein [Planctomycetota bacterium]
MQRRPSSQDISWFIDQRRHGQLDLDPPYQRKSVWNLKDRRYFLDTIFGDYPSPQVYLHKLDVPDKTVYAVVDGKQRLQTIFKFIDDEISIDPEMKNERLKGKKWSELDKNERQILWNYVIPVEFLSFDANDTHVVSLAFDRLNRNMRKLEPQELRHARWDGWFISLVEAECERPEWLTLGVVTKARSKRMKDAQFISELLLVVLEGGQHGFDQDNLDRAYGEYDDANEVAQSKDTDDYEAKVQETKEFLIAMQTHNGCVKKYANSLAPFYSLWAAVALHREELGDAEDFATKFEEFIKIGKEAMAEPTVLLEALGSENPLARLPVDFQHAAKGAATDLNPRKKRLEALMSYIRLQPS